MGNPQVHHRPVHEAGQGKISHLEGLKINCLILILLEISYLLVKKEYSSVNYLLLFNYSVKIYLYIYIYIYLNISFKRV